MKVILKRGDPDLAQVFVARFRGDDRFMAEFVDARDPDLPADKKWVIIISTQFGCPVSCLMCDSGGNYAGDLTADEMFAQIDYAISQHGDRRLASVEKFKVQFARMGEPALNPNVLAVLDELPKRYDAPGLMPCIATTAPASASAWFERLLSIRRTTYAGKPFQLQLSINSTDERARDRLMPFPKMGFDELNEFARDFTKGGPRKVSLNFALMKDVPVDAAVISDHFDPARVCVKITPLNPTIRAGETGLATALPHDAPDMTADLCKRLNDSGFDTILSIGDARENEIGSNCGMMVRRITSR